MDTIEAILFYLGLVTLLISIVISLSLLVEVYGYTGTEPLLLTVNDTKMLMPFP